MTACPICQTEYTPRTKVQETCSSKCGHKKRTAERNALLREATAQRKAALYAEKRKEAEAKQKRGAQQRQPHPGKFYTITDTLPRDLDMLWVKFTPIEMDEALEDHALPECIELTSGDVKYEVFDSLAGNGKTYQRLQADNGKVIMSKAERRVCQ